MSPKVTNNIAYGETIGKVQTNNPTRKASNKPDCCSPSASGFLFPIFLGFHPRLYCSSPSATKSSRSSHAIMELLDRLFLSLKFGYDWF